MVVRNYKYTGLSLLQESLGVDNYTANSDDGLVYTPTNPSEDGGTIVGRCYHTHHAFEGPDVLWNTVKLNLTNSSVEATPTYQNIISLYGLNDGHTPELVGEKIYTTIDATPTTVNVSFDLLSSACQSAFYKLDETSAGATVRVDLPMRYSGNFEDNFYLQSNWPDTNTKYKEITITGISGVTSTATDFAVGPIDVTYDSDMRGDFGDVRFYTQSGATFQSCSHSLIRSVNSSTARYMVKIHSLPASPSTTTLYMYYGDGTNSSASAPSDTLAYFDDFEDGLYTSRTPPYKDYTVTAGAVTMTTSSPLNGTYSLLHTGNGADNASNGVRFPRTDGNLGNDMVRFRFKLTTQGSTSNTPYVLLWFTRYVNASNYVALRTYYDGTNQRLQLVKMESGTTTIIAENSTWIAGAKLGTSTTYEFLIYDWKTGIQVNNATTGAVIIYGNYNSTLAYGTNGFGCNGNSAGKWDQIIIRPSTYSTIYAGGEPTIGATGAEVSGPVKVTPSTTATDYLVFTTPSSGWSDGDYWNLHYTEYGSSERSTRYAPLSAGDRYQLGYEGVDKYNTLRLGLETTTTGTGYTVSVDDLEYGYEI